MTGVQTCALPILEMGGSDGFLFRNEGSKSSLLKHGWFQCFSVQELKVPMVKYLEMGGSNGFLFGNRRFQKFPIKTLVVPMFFC